VQLRLATQSITGEDYVSIRLWQRARIECCPLHPQGGCGFSAHGTYDRVEPPGTKIRRWYCPRGGVTFSALPDCLSARLSGTLAALEAQVRCVEQAPSLAQAVRDERYEVGWPAVLRYFGRRVRHVHGALQAIKGLYPERFAAAVATVTDFARVLEQPRERTRTTPTPTSPPTRPIGSVLERLREVAWRHLGQLPAPLGFDPVRITTRQRRTRGQHRVGAVRAVVVLDRGGCPGQSP
jgi:hypothetical protein